MLFILILQIVNAIFWCNQKEGYYIDELWSYGLSNSHFQPFLQEKESYINHWNNSDFFKDYLTVESDERFAWNSVYYNQENDVHPPLYYIILHTVCSFFPNTFSKWLGLGINLTLFIITMWLFFLISEQILGTNSYISLIPPLCYGFCAGALSEILYIRMYMLLSIFTLFFLYLTIRIIKEQKRVRLLLFLVLLTTIMGFLTQYYYIIFAFFCTMTGSIVILLEKDIKKLFAFDFTVILGLIISTKIFPPALRHIFINQKGKDSFENLNLSFSQLIIKFTKYSNIIISELFYNIKNQNSYLGFVILTILGLCCISIIFFLLYKLYYKKEKYELFDRHNIMSWFILSFTFAGYFLTITIISTDISDRYQFPIYPLLILVILSSISFLLKYFNHTNFLYYIVIFFFIIQPFQYNNGSINYLYKGYKESLDNLETKYSKTPGIYITKGDHLVINNCLFMSKQEKVYPLYAEQILTLPQILFNEKTNTLIIYIDIYYDEEEIVSEITNILNYKTIDKLYDNTYSQIYIIKK